MDEKTEDWHEQTHTVEGFNIEFWSKPLGFDSDQYDFHFELSIRNNTGEQIEIVSRTIRILDGNGEEVHQKCASVRKELTLESGDSLKFEGSCPLPMPVGTVECEVKVKIGSRQRVLFCPPFQLINSQCLH